MPQFRYTARRSDGQLAQGVVEANDRAGALVLVEQQRCFPIKIELMGAQAAPNAAKGKKAPASPSSSRAVAKAAPAAFTGSAQSISLSGQFLFTEQLGHLLSAGMTLDEALGILVRRLRQPGLQELCKTLHQALVDGQSLSQAMRGFPKVFSPLYVNMVSAGEASGALPTIMKRLVLYLSEVKALRDRVQQALVYPAVLVVAGIGLIIIFMTVMVPQLAGFFSQTGQTLPLPTQILLDANHAIVFYWWVAVLAVALIVGIQKMATRDSAGRQAWDRFRWRIPGYGHIMRYRFFAQFARTLGTLVENGVTLLRALELLENISGSEWVRVKMVEVRKAVVDGTSLSVALRAPKIFPELLLDMMAVGEQTGHFGETMNMIADVYERELDKQVQITSALIPPVIMIVIAVVVGMVVFGILDAVFNLTTGLRTQMSGMQ
ncbi:MAG TPA: type II secretion system F family protein [Chthoniobacteraceae bacterium]|jgi:type II secretory pathway component PulF|nr:type II secretion system F family protein [Chthoniobacteraceae bacterium]